MSADVKPSDRIFIRFFLSYFCIGFFQAFAGMTEEAKKSKCKAQNCGMAAPWSLNSLLRFGRNDDKTIPKLRLRLPPGQMIIVYCLLFIVFMVYLLKPGGFKGRALVGMQIFGMEAKTVEVKIWNRFLRHWVFRGACR